jgi:hypothetical protein
MFLLHFGMQKPRFVGCFGSLQGKKVPKWHFFKILGAKRNKLLAYTVSIFVTVIPKKNFFIESPPQIKIWPAHAGQPRRLNAGKQANFPVFSVPVTAF